MAVFNAAQAAAAASYPGIARWDTDDPSVPDFIRSLGGGTFIPDGVVAQEGSSYFSDPGIEEGH